MPIAKAKERSTYVQKSRLEGDERIVVDGQHFVTPNQIIAPVKRNAYTEISRRSPGFYRADYDSLDEEYAREYFDQRAAIPNVGGCSVVAHGELVGRNLDWPKRHPDGSVDAVFEVHTSAAQGRYASFGFAGSLADLSIDAVESRRYSDAYKLLPYYLQDGLNEKGLFAAILVVPAAASRVTVPGIDKRDRVCSLALVRWILDHYQSVDEAVADLRNYVEIFHPVGLTAMGYEPHFFLKDSTHSVVLEFTGTGLVAIEINACTNFHLQGVSFKPDGTVWTNADVLDEHYPSSLGIETYGSGLERFNALVTANPEDKEGMRALLDSILFSKAYTLQTGVWYSEFVGGNITVDTPANDPSLLSRLAEYRQKYVDDDSDVWITKQSVIYDLVAGTASLTVFEGEDEYIAVLSQEGDFATIDFVNNRVAGFITKSVNDLVNYYLKSETYSRTEIQALIDAVKQFSYEVVASLPAAAAGTMHKIYLVPSADPKTQNVKEEYITIDNGAGAETRYTWEQIGSTAIDLSGYYTSQQTDTAISTALTAALGNYTNTATLTQLLAGKQASLTPDQMAAVNSGITSAKLTALERKESGWDDKYDKPSAGIPETDLSEGVKEKLNLKEIIYGYLYEGQFYKEASHTTVITPASDAQYTDLANNVPYIWKGTEYVAIGGGGSAGIVLCNIDDDLAGVLLRWPLLKEGVIAVVSAYPNLKNGLVAHSELAPYYTEVKPIIDENEGLENNIESYPILAKVVAETPAIAPVIVANEGLDAIIANNPALVPVLVQYPALTEHILAYPAITKSIVRWPVLAPVLLSETRYIPYLAEDSIIAHSLVETGQRAWLVGDGAAYINTGLNTDAWPLVVDAMVSYANNSGEKDFIGHQNKFVCGLSGNKHYMWSGSAYQPHAAAIVLNQEYAVRMEYTNTVGRKMTVDGTEYENTTIGNKTDVVEPVLFGGGANKFQLIGKISVLDLTIGESTYHYIPAMHEGKYGYLETTSMEFKGNNNTSGSFGATTTPKE